MTIRSKINLTRRAAIKIGVLTTATLVIGVSPFQKFQVSSALAADNTGSSSKQLGFSYDQKKCIGCKQCAYTCKKVNKWEAGVEWRKVHVIATDKKPVFLSMSCNHCADPACLKVCPVGAYTKREKDGIVVHNSARCVGCKYCMYACPYHAPQFGETSGAISKCSMCYQRIDEGQKPACVEACPTKALQYGDVVDLKKLAGAVTQIANLPSPEITQPSFYIIPKP
ncbi:4Fe-4S dicluster domain-containing protein [Desulfitobacterium metallireducens]|uniref:Oxidoreductase n=1 Tax=Desulfitobacterium metallireducens DSM 15288 TaxID=871968 RepID=W0E8Z2_9FIRM|nr:4Fe-4S dicluster domain-containing protein [Desulfitobacterium metallireducens]AHF07212.1 oxidoreductase [Desulfitobacterium metallireducens DSM 15288]